MRNYKLLSSMFLILVFISCSDKTSQKLDLIAQSQEYHNFRVAFENDISVNPNNENFDFDKIFEIIDKYEVNDYKDIDPSIYLDVKGAKEYFEIREQLHLSLLEMESIWGFSNLTPEEQRELRNKYFENRINLK